MQQNPPPQQPQLSADELLLFLEIDFDSGEMVWKRRSRDMFRSKRAWSTWNSKFAGKSALSSFQGDGYRCGTLLGSPVLAHRVLFAAYHGHWPEFIDHINGDRSDNRIANLRSVSKIENSCNAKKPISNSSGYVGVSWNERDRRWSAYITLNRKRKALGNFTEKEDAILCRKKAEQDFGFHPNHGR